MENVPLGHSVLHIQAVDADAGENARLRYRLVDTASASVGGGGAAPAAPAPAADFPFHGLYTHSDKTRLEGTQACPHESGGLIQVKVAPF